MPTSAIATAIAASIEGVRLLDHPYYRAWQRGELRVGDLTDYAEQYRHFECCLPDVLRRGASHMQPGGPRRLVEANLGDELSNPRPHIELFDDFAAAVGAGARVDATAATSELVDLYREAADEGAVALLGVVAAYETQAADIAATKAASLRLHYDLGTAGTEFWSVHAEAEKRHADWTVDALGGLEAKPEAVGHWAERSARAWWEFLDEREACRAA